MEYKHVISQRSRSLRLRVASNGKVILTTPPRTPQRMIESFVAAHLDWISAAQARMKSRPSPVQEDKILIFGEWYKLVVKRDTTSPVGVSIQDKQLVVVPIDPSATSAVITSKITAFIKKTAEKYIVPRTHQWAEKMDITFRAISLREQKTRWGSCSSQGNLQFNWRLVHYPPAVIDYVIIHELAHRRQMNHSSAFWDIVKEYDPAYASHRGWLKRHGITEG